jgi:hypothetical protein
MIKNGTSNVYRNRIGTATTWEELCQLERKYIIEYNTYYRESHGYNMTRGGGGIPGYTHTEETKDVIRYHSENLSEETKEKRIENNPRFWKDKELPGETCEQISRTLSTPVIVDNIIYETAKIAAETLVLNINTFRSRLANKNFPNYGFLHPPKSTPKPKRVFAFGQIYPNAMEAAEAFDISRNSLINRIKNPKYLDHYYTDDNGNKIEVA